MNYRDRIRLALTLTDEQMLGLTDFDPRHRELMQWYADGWEIEWLFSDDHDVWRIIDEPSFIKSAIYRKKRATIMIGDVEVPAPDFEYRPNFLIDKTVFWVGAYGYKKDADYGLVMSAINRLLGSKS